LNKLNTTLNPERKRGRQDERGIVVVVVVVVVVVEEEEDFSYSMMSSGREKVIGLNKLNTTLFVFDDE
jgi:hypothetical protein